MPKFSFHCNSATKHRTRLLVTVTQLQVWKRPPLTFQVDSPGLSRWFGLITFAWIWSLWVPNLTDTRTIYWWWEFLCVAVTNNINMQWIQAQLNMYVAIGMYFCGQIPIPLKHFGIKRELVRMIILYFELNYHLLSYNTLITLVASNMSEYSLDSYSLMQLLPCIMIHTIMANINTNTQIGSVNDKIDELYCYCARCLLVSFVCLFLAVMYFNRVILAQNLNNIYCLLNI